ncbi:Arc family DNA-binding protein [Neorhizobium galegae]|uniref:FitA-like ribbon-helix-helix domain-containing protein n=1 Tax=Neorhizobium galegae TaxID=399 RepID=UPI0021068693|nr:Arc family DNA-binding protein [Neorhizobium galegae]MCQ1778339.1 Arc family DNA-binding protein [Neorhizobium galegae]MCQ1796686.1 Arc family DNA-binding protein [Neorhizobium galegae]
MSGAIYQDLKIRLSPDLKQWLLMRAKENDRSMNGEIQSLLKAARQSEQQATA